MGKVNWPLRLNIIRGGKVSNTFGQVRRTKSGGIRAHQGWDFFAAPGTPCFAVGDGSIALIRDSGDYGNTIVLKFDHDGDTLYAAYSHLSRIDVTRGQFVHAGDHIGLTGNSGNAAGMTGQECHLHFELRTEAAPGLGLGGRLSPLHLFGDCPLNQAIAG